VLPLEQRPHIGDDAVIAAAAAPGGALAVVNLADAVEAHRDGKAVALEEVAIVRLEQRAVGGDRKADRNVSFACDPGRELGRPPYQGTIDQRLTRD
jgi:hypothetical protein